MHSSIDKHPLFEIELYNKKTYCPHCQPEQVLITSEPKLPPPLEDKLKQGMYVMEIAEYALRERSLRYSRYFSAEDKEKLIAQYAHTSDTLKRVLPQVGLPGSKLSVMLTIAEARGDCLQYCEYLGLTYNDYLFLMEWNKPVEAMIRCTEQSLQADKDANKSEVEKEGRVLFDILAPENTHLVEMVEARHGLSREKLEEAKKSFEKSKEEARAAFRLSAIVTKICLDNHPDYKE